MSTTIPYQVSFPSVAWQAPTTNKQIMYDGADSGVDKSQVQTVLTIGQENTYTLAPNTPLVCPAGTYYHISTLLAPALKSKGKGGNNFIYYFGEKTGEKTFDDNEGAKVALTFQTAKQVNGSATTPPAIAALTHNLIDGSSFVLNAAQVLSGQASVTIELVSVGQKPGIEKNVSLHFFKDTGERLAVWYATDDGTTGNDIFDTTRCKFNDSSSLQIDLDAGLRIAAFVRFGVQQTNSDSNNFVGEVDFSIGDPETDAKVKVLEMPEA